jgi:hypothetical protein
LAYGVIFLSLLSKSASFLTIFQLFDDIANFFPLHTKSLEFQAASFIFYEIFYQSKKKFGFFFQNLTKKLRLDFDDFRPFPLEDGRSSNIRLLRGIRHNALSPLF